AHAGDAVEYPGELRVLRHPALVEDDVLQGVDAGREEGRGHLARSAHQLGRVLPDRDRVEVDHAIDAVVALLQGDEALDGAEIVAEVEIAGRLDAGKDEGPEGIHVGRSVACGGPFRTRRKSVRGLMDEAAGPRKIEFCRVAQEDTRLTPHNVMRYNRP